MKKNLYIIGIIACLMFTGAYLYAQSAGSSSPAAEIPPSASSNVLPPAVQPGLPSPAKQAGPVQPAAPEAAPQPAPSAGAIPADQAAPVQPAAPKVPPQSLPSSSGPQPEGQNVGFPTGMGYGMGGMMGSAESGASVGMAGEGESGMMGFGYMGPSPNVYGGMGMMGSGMGMGYGMGGFGVAGFPIDVTGEMSIKPFPIGNLPMNAVCEILQRRAGGIRFYMMPNKIVAIGSKDDLHRVQQVLNQIGASMGEPVGSALPANIAYQVYIVEVPSQREEMFSFYMTLRYISLANPLTGFDEFDFDGMIVEQFSSHETDSTLVDGKSQANMEININGKTRSEKLLEELVAFIQKKVKSQVSVTGMRIEKDESALDPSQSGYGRYRSRTGQKESQSAELAPAQVIVNLPEGIQKNLAQLLGPDTQTVGYWFGNSALPGKCQTSIGNWNLSLVTIESGPSDFLLELKLTGEGVEIENTVNAKIGQPVLVGYNRNMRGMLLPGALVIIPRESFDSAPVSEIPSKSTSAAPDAAAPVVPAAPTAPSSPR
ncbi:MAG: hypothetical protein ACE15F_15230 [bacterium]